MGILEQASEDSETDQGCRCLRHTMVVATRTEQENETKVRNYNQLVSLAKHFPVGWTMRSAIEKSLSSTC